MRKAVLGLLGIAAIASVAFAGTETYSGKAVAPAPPPCPEWYADQEFNVSLWGTYVFPGHSWTEDRYLQGAQGWGGGGDVKYFFHRYFGVGIEGWVVDAKRHFVRDDDGDPITSPNIGSEHRAVGAVLGTLTLRYPIRCTRFSPYIFGGGGGIFGGGEPQFFDESDGENPSDKTETRAIGQFGGGIEVRFTPHIGWISDFSWNVVDGPHNNFGMVRTGVNFAF